MTDLDIEPVAPPPPSPAPTGTGVDALRSLRRTRQRHRLGDLDWFEAAYRVYLVGGFGGGGVLWLSSSIKDTAVAASTEASVLQHAPAVLGLLAAQVPSSESVPE